MDECAIIGLTREKLINTGFPGDVLFLLTLKIADKAMRRRQYAQNRYLSAKRRITGSAGCDTGHTLQTDIYGRRHDHVLLLWICVGVPFGIHRMFLWLVPHRFDLAGTVGVVALNIILGGVIGGFALVFQITKGIAATIRG